MSKAHTEKENYIEPELPVTQSLSDYFAILQTQFEQYYTQLSLSKKNDVTPKNIIEQCEYHILNFEKKMWAEKTNATVESNIKSYQTLFQLYEKIMALQSTDLRHEFIIVIPVADRPQLLKQCLNSLIELCKLYNYGGKTDKQYTKVKLLIADDSADKKNINQHQEICKTIQQQGINCHYFGLQQQYNTLTTALKTQAELQPVFPDYSQIKSLAEFSHKGASIMRNIAYLKLKSIVKNNALIFFADSDQTFNIQIANSKKPHFAINYFYQLDKIFTHQKPLLLTGKVVGDPPVSPAVMSANFLTDITNFLTQINDVNANYLCAFHQKKLATTQDANYHDMPELFGFSHTNHHTNYQCPLSEPHTNRDCYHHFSNKLSSFFYGAHPTRQTDFLYQQGFLKSTLARTVYTGNYIIKPEILNDLMPFAKINLRMAGPVFGRLLSAKLKDKFICANLPMLHHRVPVNSNRPEYRKDINQNEHEIDLSGEFIRQFYGDVMLICIEQLSTMNYPNTPISSTLIKRLLLKTYHSLKLRYLNKQKEVLKLSSDISLQLKSNTSYWDNNTKKPNSAIKNFEGFLNNINNNFGENTIAFKTINNIIKATEQLSILENEIVNYQFINDNKR